MIRLAILCHKSSGLSSARISEGALQFGRKTEKSFGIHTSRYIEQIRRENAWHLDAVWPQNRSLRRHSIVQGQQIRLVDLLHQPVERDTRQSARFDTDLQQ